jgi:hypothetical protein
LQGNLITWWTAPSNFTHLEGVGMLPDGSSIFIVGEGSDFARYDRNYNTNALFINGISDVNSVYVGMRNLSTTNMTSTNAYISNLVVGSCTGCGGSGADSVVRLNAVQVYTATTTWTKPSNTSYIIVELWGGGGGGGDGDGTTDGAGGGGGGGYAMKTFTSSSLANTTSVYVWVGAGGSVVASATGNRGGTSVFGGFLTSTGGFGGARGANAVALGGLGGNGVGGDRIATGTPGQNSPTTAISGNGGAGGGAGGSGGLGTLSCAGAGANGNTFGGGGGGGCAAGGGGANGGAVIYEYIATTSQGADLAEFYPINDASIGPGDIVGFDLDNPLIIRRVSKTDRRPLAGIIATQPGLLLGEHQFAPTSSRPVALAGRVPTKVNLEGGPIQIGDRIALSSESGVGKRATLFEDSVGTALEPYTASSTANKITVFINLERGVNIEELSLGLMEKWGIKITTSTFSATNSPALELTDSSALSILGNLVAGKQALVQKLEISNLNTDRILAGLEIITPRVVTQNLIIDTIETFSGTGLSINLQSGELFNIFSINSTTTSTPNNASSTPVITFDSLGNGFFAGTLTANTISANQIEGLNIIAGQISVLSSTIDQMNQASSTASSTIIVAGLETNSLLTDTLEVNGLAEFIRGISVTGSSTFIGDVTIEGNLQLMTLSVRDINSPVISFITSSLEILSVGLSDATTTMATLLQRLEANEMTLAMFASSTNTSSPALDMSALTAGQGIVFENNVMFRGGLQVDMISSITGTTTFMSDLFFFGRPYLNSDSGGYAIVASGTREVVVTFDSEYIEKPVVQAVISFRNNTSTASSTEDILLDGIINDIPTSTDWRLLESKENAIFDLDIRYIVTRVSTTGFVIRLNKPAPFDVEFDWLALAVKNPKIFGVVTSTVAGQVVPEDIMDTPIEEPENLEYLPEELSQVPVSDNSDSTTSTDEAAPEVNTSTPTEDVDTPAPPDNNTEPVAPPVAETPVVEQPPAAEPVAVEAAPTPAEPVSAPEPAL